MMFVRTIIGVCLLVGHLSAECQNGWIRFDNSCYLFSHAKFSFGDADQFCHQNGGYLVRIETKRENDFVRHFCIDLHVARRWIGINDQVQEDRWVWQGTDTDITYSDWYPGEPNQGIGANCGHLWEAHEYHWADHVCSNLYEPICESPLNSDTEIVG